jgi:hypothetical protein
MPDKVVTEATVNAISAVVEENKALIAHEVRLAVLQNQPTDVSAKEIEAVTAGVMTQDPAHKSVRLWTVFLPVLSTLAYALLDPQVIGAFIAWLQAHPGAYWGVAANFLALILPVISKLMDKRPVAGK